MDGQTWTEYAKNLEVNLQSLLDRVKSWDVPGTAGAAAHPQGGLDHRTRPIGIPTLEDKVLQRAVVMLLEPIYEQDFDTGSYGFRPRRSAHDALEDLWEVGRWTAEGRGFWRWTSASFSTRWIMPTCGSFSNTGYATAC